MRAMTILVIESADASASARSFTAQLHDNGDVTIDDLDNDHLTFDAGTPGARVLSALIAPHRSALDMFRLIPEDLGASSADLDRVAGSPVDPTPFNTTTVTTITTQVRHHPVPAVHPGWLTPAQP